MARHIDADYLKAGFEEDGHLSPYIEEYIDACPTVGEWISVDDRMPEKMGEVLVVLYGRVCIAWYHGNGQFETGSGLICYAEEVTHWMPLPEPPKEES